ncbi:MAG: hypothetical protein NTV88_05075 [Candidatus Micrarchaeota archaeon]|nr:hypothetical protein [Candidatus Micrarchaeota archaeon]
MAILATLPNPTTSHIGQFSGKRGTELVVNADSREFKKQLPNGVILPAKVLSNTEVRLSIIEKDGKKVISYFENGTQAYFEIPAVYGYQEFARMLVKTLPKTAQNDSCSVEMDLDGIPDTLSNKNIWFRGTISVKITKHTYEIHINGDEWELKTKVFGMDFGSKFGTFTNSPGELIRQLNELMVNKIYGY